MAVFLDVLPRLGLTEAESAFDRLKQMARTTGEEMGVSLGEGASAGLDKLKESAIATERIVSDANGKMASSAELLSAAQERATATAAAAASAQQLYSDALERQNALGVLTLAQSRELDALRTKATATSVAAATASARATDASTRAAAAERDHADAQVAATAATSKFAQAKDDAAKSTVATAGVLNGIGVGSFLAFGAAVGVSADKAADFQQSQTKLVASAGETTQGLKQVSDGILQLAGSVGYSAQDLSSAMYVVEKAGFDASKGGLDVLKASAQGANAEQADLAEVTKGLTISMNDFHFPTQNAADVMSKLVVATGASTATFQEFTGALHSVEPAAAAAGVKYEDLLATIAQGTKSGASADQVTENIRNALNALSGASIPAKNAMAQLGISADDVSQHLKDRGLAGSFQYLADTIKSKMDPNNLIPTGVFKQNAQELDNMTASLSAMSPAARTLAEGLRNGTVNAIEFRKGLAGSSGEDTQRLRDFQKWSNDLDDFSKRYKNGQSTLETYNQALRDVTGTVAGQSIALQVTGDNAGATNDLIAKLDATTREHDGTVKGFNESQDTLNAKMRDAKAAFGAAAIELGDVFIPILSKGADALKETAEFLAAHKDGVENATIAVGLFAGVWATVKVSLAAKGVWNALAGSIDFTIGKFAAMRAASTETAAVIEADATAEATAARGVGSAFLGIVTAIGAAAFAGKQLTDWSRDIPAIHDRFQNPDGSMKNGIDKWIVDNDIPVLKWLEPSDAKKTGAGVDDGKVPGDYNSLNYSPTLGGAAAPTAVTPTPGDGAMPVATQNPAGLPDPGTPGSGIDDVSGGGKKPKATKDDPIWIAAANPDDFKADTDHGVTGTSILKDGPDFSPKGIGTFFTALLVDLAVGNPLGKTLAAEKAGSTPSNPLYVSSVDVDKAQKALDEAVHSYGPDSTEARTAEQKLQATQAMVGTTGGYYDPKTGAVSDHAPVDAAGHYTGGVGTQPAGTTNQSQDQVAAGIIQAGLQRGLSRDQIVAGLNVAKLESNYGANPLSHVHQNQSGTDVEGIFQQDPSYSGNHDDPQNAAGQFFDRMIQRAKPGDSAGQQAVRVQVGTYGGSYVDSQNQGSVYDRLAPQVLAPSAPAAGPAGAPTTLDDLRKMFTGGGGLGPVFKQAPSGGDHPDPFAPGGALSATPGAGDQFGGIGLPPTPGGAPGSIGPFAVPGRVAAAAPGGIGNSAQLLPGMGTSPGGGWSTPPAPNAAPGSNVGQSSKPGVGDSIANTPRSWGSGKGASTTLGSTLAGAAGSIFPGGGAAGQVAGQLADRTIGYAAQVGGIAVEGLMQSLIPTGGGGGIGDPSHSLVGKIAGGVAGAHKSAPNSAGTTAPPLPAKPDDKPKQGGGDTNTHVGEQNNGVKVMGDMHVSTPDAKSFASDQPQNIYPTAIR